MIYKQNTVRIQYLRKLDCFNVIAASGFEERTIKTAQLITEGFELIHPFIRDDIDIEVCCDDYYSGNDVSLAYCKRNSEDNIMCVPDFIFVNWRQTGVYNYDETAREIYEASKIPYEYDKLFWIGALSHPTRKTLCELGESDSRIEAVSMDWIRQRGRDVTPGDATIYVSLKDHTKYKYLIDLQGHGYSGRVKMLMFSGRPLFLADRELKEYWYDGIKPFEHYIPVREDLSDLIERLDWAEKNEKEAFQIADNARKFACENLMHNNAVSVMGEILLAVSEEADILVRGRKSFG
ncbi:MAG: hypothetical protein K5987_05425 [Lachnospiraceae bacterium]|nr:hypothetical protein [Lachnospiraceae bacterium]